MPLRRADLVCQQAVELVTAYLEGDLGWRQRRRFEAHLRDCPHCRRYLDQMRTTIATMGRVEPGSLGSEARDVLVDLFHQYHGGELGS